MKFYSSKAWVQEEISKPSPAILITDSVNNYEYIITMENGKLTSVSKGSHLEILSLPTKMTYFPENFFRTEGMKVILVRQDGSSEDVSDKIYSDKIVDNIATIYFKEFGITYKIELEVEVIDFDPSIHLIDFEYETNPDGTYYITDWKETYHGEPSTIMDIPEYKNIIL